MNLRAAKEIAVLAGGDVNAVGIPGSHGIVGIHADHRIGIQVIAHTLHPRVTHRKGGTVITPEADTATTCFMAEAE